MGGVQEEEKDKAKEDAGPEDEFGDGKMVTKAINAQGFVHLGIRREKSWSVQ